MRHSTFSRSDTTPVCDRHMTISTYYTSIALHSKNFINTQNQNDNAEK